LGDDLRIARAREVVDLFFEAARQAGAVEIDAARVARVDAAGLQAVIAGIAQLRAADVLFRWGEVSAVLSDTAGLVGLSSALELP
jgi:anti-anti-sigma regulatory factor